MRRSLHELSADRTGILNLDPLEGALRGRSDGGIAPIDESLVGRPGLTLRLGVTALRTGAVHYVTESGHLVGPDAVTRLAGEPRPGVIEGVLASSSVPMLIPPRAIADEVYCDGGVLQNVPVEAAVRVGATDVVAILACPLSTPPDDRDFTGVDFVSTHLRTQAIGFYDQQRTNLTYPLAAGGHLTVVAPTVDLVGPFEVHQGLMLIDMDYGGLRAAESFAGLPAATLARAVRRHRPDRGVPRGSVVPGGSVVALTAEHRARRPRHGTGAAQGRDPRRPRRARGARGPLPGRVHGLVAGVGAP